MTTKPKVKLPELPPIANTFWASTSDDTLIQLSRYAKQYGSLCYEAGLSAGRGQAGQTDSPDYESMFMRAVTALADIHEALGLDPDDAEGAGPILEAIDALKQSLARPGQDVNGCHRIYPPDFPVMPKTPMVDSMSREDLWAYACLTGWRCGDFEKQQPAQAAVPEGLTQVNRKTLQGITDFLSANVRCHGGSPEEPPGFATQFDQQLSQVVDELQHMLNAAPDSGEG